MRTFEKNTVARAGALLVAALALHALGCGVIGTMDISVTASNECVENARAMIIDFRSATSMADAILESASDGVISAVIRDVGAGRFQLVAELDHVPTGTEVHFTFSMVRGAVLGDVALDGVQIFNVPPSELKGGGDDIACNPPAQSVETFTFSDPDLGLALRIHNGTASPIPVLLEGTDPGSAIAPEDLYYDGPMVRFQDWLPLFDGAVGQSQSVIVDIPDIPFPNTRTTSASADVRIVRMRATLATGAVQKGVWQISAESGPLVVESTTWGAVKALYRER
ncbi:MAG: hypothetical protein L0Z51_09715 [Candidatus Latescibacteria bacterium]|nr:hypothetical protein [Candidatus Latescibacterota bacterium]